MLLEPTFHRVALLGLIAVALALPGLATAQSSGQGPSGNPNASAGRPPMPPKFGATLNFRTRGIQESSLGGSNAELGIARSGFDLNLNYFASPDLILLGGFTYEDSRFAWESLGSVVPTLRSPVGSARILSGNVGAIKRLTDRWSLGTTFTVRSTGETTATSNSQETGFSIFGRYSKDRSSSFSIGFATISQLSDDPLVIPFVGYEGRVNDKLTIATVPVAAGIGFQGRYQVDPKQTYALTVAFENRNFRLGPDAPVRNGVLRDQGFPIELSYRFRPSAKVEYGASIGYLLGQTITLEAANGSTVLDRTLRPTPFIGLNAQFRL